MDVMNEKQQKYYDKAIEVIDKNKLIFIEDVVAYIGIAKSTFYDYFPNESNESNAIKELLDKNKIELKVSMRSKWYKSNSPALQMGLYRLLSTDEEMKKLSMVHNQNTNKNIDLTPLSEEERKKFSEGLDEDF